MSALAGLRAYFRRRPWAAVLVVAMLGLLMLGMFARYWITTDAGRDFVTSQIDGREIAGYGRISLRRLEGDPLSDFTIGSVEVRDAAGVWLSAEQVAVSWSPWPALTHTASISELSVSTLAVARRPVRTDRPPPAGKPWNVRLGQATIARLRLAEGVAGPLSQSSVSAHFFNEPDGRIDAELQIAPLDGAGDRIAASITRNATSAYDLKVDAIAPAGGVFAHLLRLPEASSAALIASAAGDLQNGLGEARFTIDGSDKIFLSGKMENEVIGANLRFDAQSLPVPARWAQFLGSQAEADLTALISKQALSYKIESRIAAGRIDLSGTSASRTLSLAGPVNVRADLRTLAPFWDGTERLELNGTLQRKASGFAYSGDVMLAVLPAAGLPFASIDGPVTVSLSDGRLPFSGNLEVRGAFAGNRQAASILGDPVRISGNGAYVTRDRRVLIDAVELTHRSGNAQLLGEMNLASRTLNLSGKINQSLDVLPGGIGGKAAGFVQAKGAIRDFELGLNLALQDVAAKAGVMAPLIDGRGTLRGLVRVRPEAGTAERLLFVLPGVEGQVSGRVYGAGSPDLRIAAVQTKPVEISGNSMNLGKFSGRLTRPDSALLLEGTSTASAAFISGQQLSAVSSTLRLRINNADVSGPVTLSGMSQFGASRASFVLNRENGSTQLEKAQGNLGALRFAGSTRFGDDGALETDLTARTADVRIGGIEIASLTLDGRANRSQGSALDADGKFEAAGVQLAPGFNVDHIDGRLTSSADGYRFEGRLTDAEAGAASNVVFSGSVSPGTAAPRGALALEGALFGVTVSTRKDIAWQLGASPRIDADLSVLGGRVQAQLSPGADAASSFLTLDKLAVGPLLGALGWPEIDAVVSGRASGRLFGANPEGVLHLEANSPVPGLDTSIDVDVDGQLDGRALALKARARYGPELTANAAARVPMRTTASGLVSLDRSAPLEALADISGTLDSVRLIALAYGHDVGGQVSGRLSMAGSLARPRLTAKGNLTNGTYEYGATGLSLTDLKLAADYAGEVLTLTGTGAGASGGTVSFDGKLAEREAGINVEMKRLLVYDRNGDQARLSGEARMTEGAADRVLTGALTVNEALFSLDRTAGNTIRTLNVRWTEDVAGASRRTLLDKPIRLDLDVSARRGVKVTGRGLDSDWGVDLDVTGTPSSPLLNGRATLVRGSLELAQKPFEFERGQITFDGPLDTARLDISATRDVDGFSVRTDVGGTPRQPAIELSSVPALPEDEILSRMLFGRSSVDLSALEAAELAGTLARFAGRDTGLNPITAIQAGLGVDRLRLGIDRDGNPELGVGQYLAQDVYLEVTTQGAAGNSVEVEWQPRPQVSVNSETSSTGESRLSVRWKKEY